VPKEKKEKAQAKKDLLIEVADLRLRLEEAEQTLAAIRTGGVDAIMVAGPKGEQVYALSGAEHPYRILVESMNEGALSMTEDSSIIYCNRAFAGLAGIPCGQLIGTPFRNLVSGKDEDRFRLLWKTALEGRGAAELELELNGNSFQVYVSMSCNVRDDEVTVFAVVTDLTERKKAEEALRELNRELEERVEQRTSELSRANAELEAEITERRKSEEALEKMRNILSEGQKIAHVGTFEYIAETRTTVWSEEEYRIYGLDPEGPSPAYDVMLAKSIHPDDAALLHRTFSAAVQSGSIYELEHRIIRPDGSVRWVYDRAHPYFDRNGKLSRYVGITQDITERKQAEEALKKYRTELEERVKERTRELADSRRQLRGLYSHLQSLREEERKNIAREIHDDLGQTLTALKMDLSWIARKLRDDKEGLKERFNASVSQVDKTIQSVKRVCTELRPGILDHLGLAAAIEWQAGEFQKRTGIKCEIVCDPEDIEVDTSLTTPLFRIFQESLTNILKHAKATEAKGSLRLTNSSIILEITDNGMGITEEDLSKPNSFGLLGMRERVYPWGGKVTVRGSENKGTTVEVIIPLTSGEPS